MPFARAAPRGHHTTVSRAFKLRFFFAIVTLLGSLIALAHAATPLPNCTAPGGQLSNANATCTFTVTNSNADGGGSLRQAMLDANAWGNYGNAVAGDSVVNFDLALEGQTIAIGRSLPLMFSNVTINAPSSLKPITLDGGNLDRCLFVSGLPVAEPFGSNNGTPQAISVTLRNLTLTRCKAKGGGGHAGGLGAGGALFVNYAATVRVQNVRFLKNAAVGGAASDSISAGGGGMGGSGGSGADGSGRNRGGGGGLSFNANGSYAGSGIGGIGIGGGGGFGGDNLGQISVRQGFPQAACNGGVNGGGGGVGGDAGNATGQGSSLGICGGGFGGGGSASSNSRLGGVGGGGGFFAVDTSGGFGGGAGAHSGGYDAFLRAAARGGFGGGGGSGDSLAGVGAGGFGGGAGYTARAVAPAIGGFGAGGGGGSTPGGSGGFAGGNGASNDPKYGGTGAALGAAVFVMIGGTLLLDDDLEISGGTLSAVAPLGGNATQGAALGDGFFLQGQGALTFAPGFGTIQTVASDIADQTGSWPTLGIMNTIYYETGGPFTGNWSYSSVGNWSLIKNGAGTLLLEGNNTYSGTSVINSGELSVNHSAALGFGSWTNNARLRLQPGTNGARRDYTLGSPAAGMPRSDYQQSASGALRVRVHEAGCTAYTKLAVKNSVTLDGALEIEFRDGCVVTTGDAFTFVTAGSVIGTFASVKPVDALPPDLSLLASYGATGVTVTVIGPPTILNVDNSNFITRYDAATDGVLILRYLLGYRDAALIANARGDGPQLRDATQIVTYLDSVRAQFDVDGDGQVYAMTDGLLILRRMLGLSGGALTSNAKVGVRSDVDIAAAIDALRP